ncbi:MAG: molybdopterin cofactor-binding domain-containing protein [Clostridia bacterium]|nr:molybdopterin cofactor-binding domain-containing protein [Clostridia bacterium]
MKFVNKNRPSVDGKGLMMGKPGYTDDLAEANSLIIKVLRSPHPHAKIVNIDSEKATALSGVECVLTYKDFKRIPITRAGQGYPEPSPHDKFILDNRVRHIGDEVAAVAAVDNDTAEKALQLIDVEYEQLEPVLDFEKAIGNKSIIHPEPEIHEMFPVGFDPEKNIASSYTMHVGDVDKTLSECEVVLEETFYTQAQAHTMMEPHTANARIDYQGRLMIYSSTQTPVHVRRILSHALEFPLSKIRVIKPRIGGGYGGKQCLHGEFLVAAVTLRTGKPSKIVYTRKEVYESTFSRHPMRFDVKLGAMKDGTLKGIDIKVLSDTGAYGEHALTVFMVAGSKVLPLYNKVDSVRFEGDVVYTNHTPAGAFRGYGAIQGNYAMESAVDMLCEKLGVDPVEFRVKNMIKEGETSPIFEIMGEGTEGSAMVMESCKLEHCVTRGAQLIGWNNKYPRSVAKDGKIRGVGMAIAMQGSGIANIDMGSAMIKLNDDGFFNLMVGATEIGQGSDTILGQIAAEGIGVNPDKVITYSSDSDLTPFDTGAYASSTTYISGNAVKLAADSMRKMIIEEGAKALGTPVGETNFNGKTVESAGKSITLAELSNRLYYNEDQKQLVAVESYVGTISPPPFMAGFAEVEIDPGTGKVELLDYAAVVDCGTTINPALARVQVEGGLVQGIGMAMYEDVVYTSKGGFITNNMMNYRIPTRKEITKISVEFADSYEPSGPYGAKSVGEIGIDTPPAAITNAIYNAVGVRIKELPVTSEKVLMGILELNDKENGNG